MKKFELKVQAKIKMSFGRRIGSGGNARKEIQFSAETKRIALTECQECSDSRGRCLRNRKPYKYFGLLNIMRI